MSSISLCRQAVKWEFDHKEVEMPNRVDAAGLRPTAARPDVQNRAQQAPEPEPARETTPDVDRGEISETARLQAEATRPQAGGNPRGAAVDAPSANPPRPGVQGAVNEGAAEQQAEQIREDQAQRTQENAERPPERQGNLVDVVG